MGTDMENAKLLEACPKKLSTFMTTQVKSEYFWEEEGVISADLWLETPHTVSARLYIEKNKPFLARMDYVSSALDLDSNYFINSKKMSSSERSEIVSAIEQKQKELNVLMETHGYSFRLSHAAGDGTTEYWDISIPMESWEDEPFLLLWRKLDEVVKFTLDSLENAGFKL